MKTGTGLLPGRLPVLAVNTVSQIFDLWEARYGSTVPGLRGGG